jgi:hypothetical protein
MVPTANKASFCSAHVSGVSAKKVVPLPGVDSTFMVLTCPSATFLGTTGTSLVAGIGSGNGSHPSKP